MQFVLVFLQTRAGGVVAWLSLFNFNLFQSSGDTCVAPLPPLAQLATGLFLPLVGFGLLLWNAFLHWLLWMLLRTGRCDAPCPPAYAKKRSGIRKMFAELRLNETFWPVFNTYRRTFLAFLCSSCTSTPSRALLCFVYLVADRNWFLVLLCMCGVVLQIRRSHRRVSSSLIALALRTTVCCRATRQCRARTTPRTAVCGRSSFCF